MKAIFFFFLNQKTFSGRKLGKCLSALLSNEDEGKQALSGTAGSQWLTSICAIVLQEEFDSGRHPPWGGSMMESDHILRFQI